MSTAVEAGTEISADQRVMDLEKEYLLQNYARYPMVLSHGKGCWVYDTSGKKYLDFISGIGVNALGHAHPRLVKIIKDQAPRMLHISNLYFHEYQGRLAERLAKISGLQRSFFSNSGAEAMEGAIKMMRSHGSHVRPEKYEIVSLENSFHGRTIGAISITGQHKYRKDFEPLLPGARFIRANDIGALEQVIHENTCGVVIEPIQGEGGIYPMSSDFVRKCRELCDRHDALLVFDEIQCGVGRPGQFFTYQLTDPVVLPDIMVAAKPLGAGIPLGCIVANERAAKSIGSGMHGSTFGGGPLACRVAIEVIDIIEELLPSIRNVGAYFQMRLQELARKHDFIKEVRGEGLMIGVELSAPCKQLVTEGMAAGMLFNCTHETVLRFLPPYIVTQKEVDKAISILSKLFKTFKPNVQ